MYKKLNFSIYGLVLALFLFSHVCLAQEQINLHLNNVEVNLRSGISLAEYQQLEEVSLQVKSINQEYIATFEEIKVFRARGPRPLEVLSHLHPGDSLNITKLLRNAEAGDRLVIELLGLSSTEGGVKTSQVVTLALH